MDSVGSVALDIKVLKEELIKEAKQAAKEAAVAAQKEANSASKAFSKSIGSGTSALGGLASVAKKAAGVLGIAFSAVQVVNFGKACIDLGSDLAEVQNVVDVVYGNMSDDVNSYAQAAIKSYGMSETVAKNYMGTLGAMSKAFGFSTQEAYGQAEALTALAGDMASFYNKSTDETFTALKAVYSGETEVLKQYGVVMNETALNEFAMAQGMGKTVKQMSEQEKVSLRLAFVQDRLSAASGDFQRTSGGWANQVRVLTLQFDSFKATIGQGLINVLTPIVQWLNMIMEAANKAAQAFSNFTASLMGVSVDADGGISGIADTTAQAADNMQDFSSGVKSAGGAAKKAMQKLAGFDKINTLNSDSSSGGGGAASKKTLANTKATTAATNDAAKATDKWKQAMDGVVKKTKQVKDTFVDGFKDGFGDFDISGIKNNLKSIKDSVYDIFNDPSVSEAGNRFMTNLAYGMGQTTGAFARISTTIADTITGGISLFLEQHAPEIKTFLVDMFDISGDTALITGRLSKSIANIFQGSFGTEAGKQLVANLINIPSQIFMTVTEIGAKIGRDLLGGFTTVISDNEAGITSALSEIVETVSSVTTTISDAVTHMGQSIQTTYDTYISPSIANVSEGLSELTGSFLEFWEAEVKPILDDISINVQALWNDSLKPLWDSLMEFIGSLVDNLTVFWNTTLKPIIDWIIKNVLPVITPIIRTIINVFLKVVGVIGTGVRSIIDVLGGLITFISGVLTGDWEKAWGGIKKVFSGIWDGILGILCGTEDIIVEIFKGVLGVIKGALNTGLGFIEGFINKAIRAINTLLSGISAVGKAVGFEAIPKINEVKLPRLAQGGFVEANTPQLALIGDNKHEGEIVAPESKITEAVAAAMMQVLPYLKGANTVATSGAGNTATNITLMLDGQVLYDSYQKYDKLHNGRSGGRA